MNHFQTNEKKHRPIYHTIHNKDVNFLSSNHWSPPVSKHHHPIPSPSYRVLLSKLHVSPCWGDMVHSPVDTPMSHWWRILSLALSDLSCAIYTVPHWPRGSCSGPTSILTRLAGYFHMYTYDVTILLGPIVGIILPLHCQRDMHQNPLEL